MAPQCRVELPLACLRLGALQGGAALTRGSARLRLETGQEEDGRRIAGIRDRPGGLADGATRAEAVGKAEALALSVLADRLDQGGAGCGPRGPVRRVSRWPAARASRVLAALVRIGWRVARQAGSHRVLRRDGHPDGPTAGGFAGDRHEETWPGEERGPERRP
jgi:hypothetical protein